VGVYFREPQATCEIHSNPPKAAEGEGEIAMRLHERIHAMRHRRRRLSLRDRFRHRRLLVELGLKAKK
jgi:hypothetical protein